MGFSEAVRTCLRKYASFSGRATRSEYWWFQLLYAIVYALCVMALVWQTEAAKTGEVSLLASLITLLFSFALLGLILPEIAVFVRRLHDTNRSGWWFFLGLVPLIGGLVLLVFVLQRGTSGENRFGPDPLSAE